MTEDFPELHMFGRRFMNEKKRTVTINVTRNLTEKQVSVIVKGPDSEVEWTLTEKEAMELKYAIGRVFG